MKFTTICRDKAVILALFLAVCIQALDVYDGETFLDGAKYTIEQNEDSIEIFENDFLGIDFVGGRSLMADEEEYVAFLIPASQVWLRRHWSNLVVVHAAVEYQEKRGSADSPGHLHQNPHLHLPKRSYTKPLRSSTHHHLLRLTMEATNHTKHRPSTLHPLLRGRTCATIHPEERFYPGHV